MIEALRKNRDLTDNQFLELLTSDRWDDALKAAADEVRRGIYGDAVYLRGLIEFTNYCRNDCLYCGIRRSNRALERYRLTPEEILACCREGHALGFRTFVLQGGEDPYWTDDRVCQIVSQIREGYPDCAITLSIGEKSREAYQRFYDAGADRYLLRHETADPAHYAMLHPAEMSCENRKRCLYDLREIGFQIGAGIMVGAPFQTPAHILADIRFMQDLQPHMIGIGPFLPHKDTPFRDQKPGELQPVLRLLGILRLLFPDVLLPATTALGTLHPLGRELGLQWGANVIMPNLSPVGVREKYMLYDNKICTGEESAQCRGCMERRVTGSGYRVVMSRGDSPRMTQA